VAAHLLAARDFGQARTALLAEAAAHLGVHAYRDAARALRSALDLWPPGDAEAQRLLAASQLAHCAEMCADHAESVVLLRELADSSLRCGDHRGRAGANRRLAMAHEMLGQWDAALAAREAAASAFATAGNPAEAAVERLAAAAHLRSAAAYSAALDLLIARLHAGLPLDARYLASLGHGGLLGKEAAWRIPPYEAALDDDPDDL